MLFIKNWNKASLDKSSNSIVSRYKSKISSLADKTESLRQLLNDLYDEAVVLNDRIKVDKQAIQEDLNDTATDLRETCNNSSWGQAEIESVQGLLDEAEEDISDIQTDIDIATGCLVVCQSGQGSDCGQPCDQPCSESCNQPCSQSCNESACNPCEACDAGQCDFNDNAGDCFLMDSEEEEDCAVIVGGVFNCTGVNTIIDDCYGGCYNNQSCEGQKKTCPKCHGSEIDIIEICTYCETDQKTTCGSFDTQDGCDTDNTTGNCDTDNKTGNCDTKNTTGDCSNENNVGSCFQEDGGILCKGQEVSGNCGKTNDSPTNIPAPPCNFVNTNGTLCKAVNQLGDCVKINSYGDCFSNNKNGDCYTLNKCTMLNTTRGTCQINDNDTYCDTDNDINQEKCGYNDNGAENCIITNNNGDCNNDNNIGDCQSENNIGDCQSDNNIGNCTTSNPSGDCYSDNTTGNCQTENATGECTSQACSSGQDCTGCIEDQKQTTTTEKCNAGANIGEEEYCDSCQGTESSEVEISQEELEKDCGPMFENGADACGPEFANCFNTSECDGATWGAASGCGNLEGCGSCNENDSCTDGQSCATGQVCGTNDCGQDCYECGDCQGGCQGCEGGCQSGCQGGCQGGEGGCQGGCQGDQPPPCDDSCDCDGYVPCDYGCSGYEGCDSGCDGCDGPDFA